MSKSKSTKSTSSRKPSSAKAGSSSSKRGTTRAPIKVTQESKSGRNEQFETAGGRKLSRAALVREIKQGHHPKHHVRVINGVETPVSNPDTSASNNLDDS